jgi:predicted dehydrogenase
MSDYMNKKVWLVGTGDMADEYVKVLSAMGIVPVVIGRGKESAEIFGRKTGLHVISGGIESFLQTGPAKPDAVIIAVNVVNLARTAACVLEYCQAKILLEKPGAINTQDMEILASCKGSENLFIAYNRRFFSSTQAVRNMIQEDGGPVSCLFEFTEWGHRIESLCSQKDPCELDHWLIANSSHVIDTAFFLAGIPSQISVTVTGALPWHKAGVAFSGSGLTSKGATFSYHANWDAPGRWGIDIMSRNRRFRMCPMESVQVQHKGETGWTSIALQGELDQQFKPGLYAQVEAFFNPVPSPDLCRFEDHVRHFPVFQKIAGYRD